MKIGIAQINSVVGDISGNTEKIIDYIRRAKAKKVDLIIFPELAICGYPPKDLLLKKDFIKEIMKNVRLIAKNSKRIAVILGTVLPSKKIIRPISFDVSMTAHFPGYTLYNVGLIINNGRIIGHQAKTYLPNYDIFDEKRYFAPAKEYNIFKINKQKIGITICEDIWGDDEPIKNLIAKGADLMVNISASPFYIGKYKLRTTLVKNRARKYRLPFVYANLVGGQDDLVFDGGSFVYSETGRLIGRAKRFEEDFIIVDLDKKVSRMEIKESEVAEVYSALVLGLRDYVNKNGFDKVILGLSGGIDSALVACLAVSALGRNRVVAVIMPGPFSSISSKIDATLLAHNLGIQPLRIPIDEIYEVYLKTLSEQFKGLPFNATEENIQARIRGNILMALSNKFGYLVLSTGNKSELAVGYSTLYGDMAGGLAVISDVPKTLVYKLCRFINAQAKTSLIPKNIFEKAPSAELRPNQKDQDDLPPYEILDKILYYYIEENLSKDEIIKKGFDKKIVAEIIRRVDHNEYKRHQAPLGIKITPKAFGFGRRMPITNAFNT
ncbi:MAG: NAD+ synthase [candidate division WOR-3 bacterium]|nr:NAD+ synthase [candidate division WOR-3 bacterium]